MKVVLTIAGSDSGGGAGIQADLKTFEAHRVFGTSVLTAITAQNTVGVRGIQAVSPEMITAQLEAIFDDFEVAALKTGMLGTVPTLKAVAAFLRSLPKRPPLVADPVMVATSGDRLLAPEAITALQQELLPLADVITPNVPEAEVLTGKPIPNLTAAREAAIALGEAYPKAFILLKCAHLLEDAPANQLHHNPQLLAKDILFHRGEQQVFAQPFVNLGKLHGTGCTLSAALAALLAQGYKVPQAVPLAKQYVTNSILYAPKNIGKGSLPLLHHHD